MAVQAALEARAHFCGKRNPAIWRVPDYQVKMLGSFEGLIC
jgi:hypothetical protein